MFMCVYLQTRGRPQMDPGDLEWQLSCHVSAGPVLGTHEPLLQPQLLQFV